MCCEIDPVWSERSVKTTHQQIACDRWSWTARGSVRRGNVTSGVYLIHHFRSPFVRSTTRHENVDVKILCSLSPLTLSRLRKSACGRKRRRQIFKTCHVKFIHVSLACFDRLNSFQSHRHSDNRQRPKNFHQIYFLIARRDETVHVFCTFGISIVISQVNRRRDGGTT